MGDYDYLWGGTHDGDSNNGAAAALTYTFGAPAGSPTAAAGRKVCAPYAGAGWHGFYTMPEGTDLCVVGLQNGDAGEPVVLGHAYNTNFTKADGAAHPVLPGEVRQKQFISPLQNLQIIMQDKPGQITLADNGQADHITLKVGSIDFVAEALIALNAPGGSVNIDVSGNFTVNTGNFLLAGKELNFITPYYNIFGVVYDCTASIATTFNATMMTWAALSPKFDPGKSISGFGGAATGKFAQHLSKVGFAMPSGMGFTAVNVQINAGKVIQLLGSTKLENKGKPNWRNLVIETLIQKMFFGKFFLDIWGQFGRDVFTVWGTKVTPWGSAIGLALSTGLKTLVAWKLAQYSKKLPAGEDCKREFRCRNLNIEFDKYDLEVGAQWNLSDCKKMVFDGNNMTIDASDTAWFYGKDKLEIQGKDYSLNLKDKVKMKAKSWVSKAKDKTIILSKKVIKIL